MGMGSAPKYLSKFNGYVLPGYVQSEDFDSTMGIADHTAAYVDGSLSEITGLSSKALNLGLKVWEQDYLACKNAVQQASSYLRSTKVWGPLYVMYTDRHYDAIVKGIKMSKNVPSSVRTLEYSVEFLCRPWLISDTSHTISGTGTITTDSVSRTIDNGGWTPTVVTVSGTNISIAGTSETGESTGLITISGSVTGLVVDTEAFTAIQGGVNKNSQMTSTDYRLFVGQGKTTFVITGASSCSITYHDRWLI